jgi:hypothetical protein
MDKNTRIEIARGEQALVVVTLSTATLIACFSLLLASL